MTTTIRLFSDALKDEDYKKEVFARKADGETVVEVLSLSSKFDEWDLEMYFQRLKELPISQLYIVTNDKQCNFPPRYNSYIELEAALNHFALLIGYEKKSIPGDNSQVRKFKVFKLGENMKIFFELYSIT